MAKKMARDFSAHHKEQNDKTTNQWGGYEISRAKKVHWGEKKKIQRKYFYLDTAKHHNQKYTAREMPPAIITFPTVCITKAFTSTVN